MDVDQRDCRKPLIDTLITDERFCDILAVNITDKRYDASNDECYKIFRTYTVINWCAYEDKCGDPMAAGNVYIVDRKWTDNGKLPVWLLVRDENRDGDEEFYLSRNRTPKEGNLGDGVVSPIGNNTANNDERVTPNYCETSKEYYHSFMYTQIIKVYDEVAPEISFKRDTFCTSPITCVANVKIPFTAKDNCTDRLELERAQVMVAPFQTLTGPYIMSNSRDYIFSFEDDGKGKYAVSVTNLPEGLHDLIVVVRDEWQPDPSNEDSIPGAGLQGSSADLHQWFINRIDARWTRWWHDGRLGQGFHCKSKIYDCNGRDQKRRTA